MEKVSCTRALAQSRRVLFTIVPFWVNAHSQFTPSLLCRPFCSSFPHLCLYIFQHHVFFDRTIWGQPAAPIQYTSSLALGSQAAAAAFDHSFYSTLMENRSQEQHVWRRYVLLALVLQCIKDEAKMFVNIKVEAYLTDHLTDKMAQKWLSEHVVKAAISALDPAPPAPPPSRTLFRATGQDPYQSLVKNRLNTYIVSQSLHTMGQKYQKKIIVCCLPFNLKQGHSSETGVLYLMEFSSETHLG